MSDQHSLRILHVSEVHWGGVVSLLRHFTAEQAHAGHEVHLLAPADMPRFQSTTQHDWRFDRGRPWTLASALTDLRRIRRMVRPDVVHLHSFLAGLIGRFPPQGLWSGSMGATVYQPHAWSFDLFQRRRVGDAVRRWETWATRRTDVMVTNCEDEIDEGRASGIDVPAHTIGVALDIEHFHPVSDDERHRHRQKLEISAQHVLVCVGRLARQKGQDLLLQAWEKSRPPDTLLVLVGPGDPDALRGHAPGQWGRSVLAVGEDSDVRPWLWASDALVLSSRYETVGLAVAEAMACGRPVTATAVNGAAATIVDGPLPTAGAVVPLGDMVALIDESSRRTGDRQLRRTEELAARQRAEQLFRPSEVALRLERAYREAIDVHREGKNAWSAGRKLRTSW